MVDPTDVTDLLERVVLPVSPLDGLTAEFGVAVTPVQWKWRPDGQTYTPVDAAHLVSPDGGSGEESAEKEAQHEET